MRERFYKQIFQLKVPFSFDFHLSINICTWNTNLDFFDPFLGWWPHQGGGGEGGESKLQNSERVLSKMKSSPQVFLYCWLSSFYMKYKTGPFLTQLWVNDVTTGVKTVRFWESDIWNKILTSMFHQIFISIFPSLFTQDIQLWTFFTHFGNNDVTKGTNILNFWNIN